MALIMGKTRADFGCQLMNIRSPQLVFDQLKGLQVTKPISLLP